MTTRVAVTTINDARALLTTIRTIAPSADVNAVDHDAEILAKAEEDLWAWYLEWSQIARIAITQRALLKQMGFVSTIPKGAATIADPGNGSNGSNGNGASPVAPPAPVSPAAPHVIPHN